VKRAAGLGYSRLPSPTSARSPEPFGRMSRRKTSPASESSARRYGCRTARAGAACYRPRRLRNLSELITAPAQGEERRLFALLGRSGRWAARLPRSADFPSPLPSPKGEGENMRARSPSASPAVPGLPAELLQGRTTVHGWPRCASLKGIRATGCRLGRRAYAPTLAQAFCRIR